MNNGLNVLLVGSGSREAALAWKIMQSPLLNRLFVAPGIGNAHELGVTNVYIAVNDVVGLIAFALQNKIDLIVVGPELPLTLGIADRARDAGIRVFGPTQAAAKIESSKTVAKEVMVAAGVPTARYRSFGDVGNAVAYVHHGNEFSYPLVVKADGLASGKGVRICRTVQEAELWVREVMQAAGSRVVIEEFLQGREASLHAFCDGATFAAMPITYDYKFLGTAMTGGVGAWGTGLGFDDAATNVLYEFFVGKPLHYMAENGIPFAGCFYPGTMLTLDGPRALEDNARFGDPETQVLMRLLISDLLPILMACAEGTLGEFLQREVICWRQEYAVCVVLCAGGYPDADKLVLDQPITGFDLAVNIPDVEIFHGGTRYTDGVYYTAGGRVASVTAYADRKEVARARAYAAADLIQFDGKQYHPGIAA